MDFIIKYRDPEQKPAVKHQHTSGRIRKTKTKPIFCEYCGEKIPETEIKTQRKNRKYHKVCFKLVHRGTPITDWKHLHNNNFITAFDREFDLKPIEVKGELK